MRLVFTQLFDDMLREIFEFLSVSDFPSFALICKITCSIVTDPEYVNKVVVATATNNPTLQMPSTISPSLYSAYADDQILVFNPQTRQLAHDFLKALLDSNLLPTNLSNGIPSYAPIGVR